jgi:hypothetical protein
VGSEHYIVLQSPHCSLARVLLHYLHCCSSTCSTASAEQQVPFERPAAHPAASSTVPWRAASPLMCPELLIKGGDARVFPAGGPWLSIGGIQQGACVLHCNSSTPAAKAVQVRLTDVKQYSLQTCLPANSTGSAQLMPGAAVLLV